MKVYDVISFSKKDIHIFSTSLKNLYNIKALKCALTEEIYITGYRITTL